MMIPPCVPAFISEPGALQPMSGPHSASLGENVLVSAKCKVSEVAYINENVADEVNTRSSMM